MTRAWSTKRGASDPALTSRAWRAHRAYWTAQRLPCSRCGGPIDYGDPRYLPGTRRLNPRYLVVGHIVSRRQARLLGWPEQRINARANTQPECQDCSNRSGAAESNHARRSRGIVVVPIARPVTSRSWLTSQGPGGTPST